MALIDCSQVIEAHWAFDSFPFVSQSYADGDEFQEFGLAWSGRGFSYSSAPGWRIAGAPSLDDLAPETFAAVASIVDLTAAAQRGRISPGDFTDAVGGAPLRPIVILKTGHADAIPLRRREYWTLAPEISPAIAEMAAERGAKHLCVDVSCDPLPSRRPDQTGGHANPNEVLRRRAHHAGLVVTENLRGLSSLPGAEAFFFIMPLRGDGLTTAPCRPVAMTDWPSDTPIVRDVSTPFMNHWRWRFDIWKDKDPAKGDDRDETHWRFMGHCFTHCDAPHHMARDGATLQAMDNEGLDRFIGPAWIVDLSDLPLLTRLTRDLIAERAGPMPEGMRVILRTDLTNRLGYASTKWHTDAPNLEVEAAAWLLARSPAALCLDFPQDFIAREMPGRHVYNHEFETHHAVFAAGTPFVEDLRDIGESKRRDPFLAAVPLRMTCIDGAPMRAFLLDW